MIYIKDLSLSFGSQIIFNNVSLSVTDDQRIGLVGRNGAGKSTFLKIVAGLGKPDSGVITISQGFKVAYMPQEVVLNSPKAIFEEAMVSYKIIGKLRARSRELEPLLEAQDADAVQEYAAIMEEMCDLSVESAEQEVTNLLLGLGFKEEQLQAPVDSLSLGWKMRLVLAQLLLQKADFYLFDEPTNHLDIVAKEWFLQFLRDSSFGFLLVCHDRYFLDEICTEIFELERGKGTLYKGNYTHYIDQKEFQLEALHAAYEQQQREVSSKQKVIDKFKAGTRASVARSMQKALDKVEMIELPPRDKTVKFRFDHIERSGRIVLEIENVSFAFGEKMLFKDVSFKIERGQKVALIASNGVGKTTLFNVIIGKLKALTGKIEFGYKVTTAVFEQDQYKALDPRKTIIEEVLRAVSHKSEAQIRSFLGAFLFSGDGIQKKTNVLSGGERNRVSMAKVLLQDANFLMLDEPTNHLDMESKDVLLQALQQYDGTLLFVSHDQDFVNRLADHIFELTPDGVFTYAGNYDSYCHQKAAANSKVDAFARHVLGQDATGQKQEGAATANAGNKKELHNLERVIAKLEQSITKIGESFADLEYGTPQFEAAQQKLSVLEKEKALATKQWEKLSELV